MTLQEAQEIYQTLQRDGLLSETELAALDVLICSSPKSVDSCGSCRHFALHEDGSGICLNKGNFGTRVNPREIPCSSYALGSIILSEDMLDQVCRNCVYYNPSYGECTALCLSIHDENSSRCYGSLRFRSKYAR